MTSEEINAVRNPKPSNNTCKCGCAKEKKFGGLHLGVVALNAQGEILKTLPVWICDKCNQVYIRGEL